MFIAFEAVALTPVPMTSEFLNYRISFMWYTQALTKDMGFIMVGGRNTFSYTT